MATTYRNDALEAEVRDQILAALTRSNETNTRGPRPSNAGRCPRAIYYDWTSPEAQSSTTQSLVSPLAGSGIHHILGSALEALGHEIEFPVKIDAGEFEIPGHLDWGHDGTCRDLKVVGYKAWNWIKNKPKDEHVRQVNLYATARGYEQCALIYINLMRLIGLSAQYDFKNRVYRFSEAARDLETKVFSWQTDELLARQTVGEFEHVYQHVVQGREPVRSSYYDPEKFPCAWCAYKTHCWQD